MSATPDWTTACPNWRERLLAGESLVPDLPLFKAEADRALRIFKRLRIPDVIGTPTMAEACGPWFFPIVAAVFGCYDPETHQRMLQEFFLLIPKGNSKTGYGGPLMLTAVIMNRRPEAGFSFIAPTIKIAELAFDQADGTIRLDPELDKLFHIQRHIRTITHRTTGAELKIKAADTDVVTGGKDVGTMIDETHVFAKKSDAAAIFVELRGALAKRKDGFLFQTTTQSKEPPQGVFKQEVYRARAVRDGTRRAPLLPVLYEYPQELLEPVEGQPNTFRWMVDRKLWKLVNPNLGRSIDEPTVARFLEEAADQGIDQLTLVASQHFNIEIGLRLTADRWRGADLWEDAGEPGGLSLEDLLNRCEVAVVGIDGGGLDDLFGLCVAGREKLTKRWLYWFKAWAHRSVLDLRKEIAPALLGFEEDGDLILCDDATQDIAEVIDLVGRVEASGLLPEKSAVGLDPQGVGILVDGLASIGLDHPRVVGVPQGFRLSSAVWSMERKLKDGMIGHSGSRLMAWCVGNAKAEQRGNAVLITKEAAGKSKIDPLVAGFNATKLLEANPEAHAGVDAWLQSLRGSGDGRAAA